jgi:hypothetical protein
MYEPGRISFLQVAAAIGIGNWFGFVLSRHGFINALIDTAAIVCGGSSVSPDNQATNPVTALATSALVDVESAFWLSNYP